MSAPSSPVSPALAIAAAVRAGERSAVEVLDEHLAVVEAREGEIHAFNLVTADTARTAAAEKKKKKTNKKKNK